MTRDEFLHGGSNYVPADEVDRDDLPRRKSPVSANMQKMATKIKVLETQLAQREEVKFKNFNHNDFKPQSKKSPITFSYGNNRIAYWKDGYWYDNETDEEVPDKWTGKVSPNYRKTSNEGGKEND